MSDLRRNGFRLHLSTLLIAIQYGEHSGPQTIWIVLLFNFTEQLVLLRSSGENVRFD